MSEPPGGSEPPPHQVPPGTHNHSQQIHSISLPQNQDGSTNYYATPPQAQPPTSPSLSGGFINPYSNQAQS